MRRRKSEQGRTAPLCLNEAAGRINITRRSFESGRFHAVTREPASELRTGSRVLLRTHGLTRWRRRLPPETVRWGPVAGTAPVNRAGGEHISCSCRRCCIRRLLIRAAVAPRRRRLSADSRRNARRQVRHAAAESRAMAWLIDNVPRARSRTASRCRRPSWPALLRRCPTDEVTWRPEAEPSAAACTQP